MLDEPEVSRLHIDRVDLCHMKLCLDKTDEDHGGHAGTLSRTIESLLFNCQYTIQLSSCSQVCGTGQMCEGIVVHSARQVHFIRKSAHQNALSSCLYPVLFPK